MWIRVVLLVAFVVNLTACGIAVHIKPKKEDPKRKVKVVK